MVKHRKAVFSIKCYVSCTKYSVQGHTVKDFSEMTAFFLQKMVWVMTNTFVVERVIYRANTFVGTFVLYSFCTGQFIQRTEVTRKIFL